MRLVSYRGRAASERAGLLRGDDGRRRSGRALRQPARRRRILAAAWPRPSPATRSPLADVELLPPDPRPGEDRLHRPQLPRARGGGRDGPARQPDLLRQVPQRAGARRARRCRCPRRARRSTSRPRSRSSIGRPAKDVAADDALDHVAGYTLLNDLSARDLQFATPQWMPGKVFDGSAPLRAGARHPRRGGSARRDRDRARPERRADAGGVHRRPDLLGPRARRPPLAA